MHAEDRTIHFSTELIHPPLQRDKAKVQEFYFELSKIPGVGYDNTEFRVPNQPRFYTRRGDKTQSVMVLLPDRMLMIEEWADTTVAGFTDKIGKAIDCARNVMNIGPILAQTATIRSVCTVSHYDNAKSFLMDTVCNQQGRVDSFFQRPVAVGGLRFVLPATPEFEGTYHIGIEPFRQGVSEVFVELKGVYKTNGGEGITTESLATHLHEMRAFIADNIYPYLNQYDTAQT